MFAYRYMETEKYRVKKMKMYKDLSELLAELHAECTWFVLWSKWKIEYVVVIKENKILKLIYSMKCTIWRKINFTNLIRSKFSLVSKNDFFWINQKNIKKTSLKSEYISVLKSLLSCVVHFVQVCYIIIISKLWNFVQKYEE